MKNWSVVAHAFGLLGELSNLIGAWIFATDLFKRREEHRKIQKLEDFKQWAKEHEIEGTFQEEDLGDEKFAIWVVDREASGLARRGIWFLIVGFVLLLIYHLIEGIEALHLGVEN